VCDKNQSPQNVSSKPTYRNSERAISFATKKCEELDISIERRGRRRFRKRMPGEKARDASNIARKAAKSNVRMS
jgi:hypothetical protein